MTDRPTLARAILEYANQLALVAENPIAGHLRDLVREFADTEDSEPPDEEPARPPMRWPSEMPTGVSEET